MPLLGAGALAKKIESQPFCGWIAGAAANRGPSHQRTDQGFASVDALVALTILVATVALVLQNAETAKRLALAANETRQAQSLGRYFLEVGEKDPGLRTGRSGGFVWSLEVDASSAANDAKARLCRHKVALTAQASGRRYALETAEPCPATASS